MDLPSVSCSFCKVIYIKLREAVDHTLGAAQSLAADVVVGPQALFPTIYQSGIA